MKELKRTKFVGFRVTADEYTKIENAAFASGHDPNDWCRAAVIGCSHYRLTVNERLIYTEIAAFAICLRMDSNCCSMATPRRQQPGPSLLRKSIKDCRRSLPTCCHGADQGRENFLMRVVPSLRNHHPVVKTITAS